MAKTKKVSGKPKDEKSFLQIAGEKAEALKEELIAGKDKIVSAAGEKFESVKKAIHDYTAPTKAAKKIVTKKPIKKAVKKAAKKIAKKK